MTDLNKTLKMLKSPKASVRYEACEELRLATVSSPEVILALEEATRDEDEGMVERARKALEAEAHQQMAIKMGRFSPVAEPISEKQVVSETEPVPESPRRKVNPWAFALAIAALVIGSLLVCRAALFVDPYFIRSTSTVVFSSLAIVLGGICMIYGSVKLIRSSFHQITASSAWQNILIGAATGCITFITVNFLGIVIFPPRSYTIILFTYVYLIGVALLIGLPAGGIGGWLFGRFWKNKNAAMIGGFVFVIIGLLILVVPSYL